MISYIDIAFLVVTALMVFINAKRGLVVSILLAVRVIILVPLSYYLAVYVKDYVPAELIEDIPNELQAVVIFVACFIVLLILSAVLIFILKQLQKKKGMPLRYTNALLGGAFGFVKALAVVLVISAVLGAVTEYLPSQLYEAVNSSFAVEFVNETISFNI